MRIPSLGHGFFLKIPEAPCALKSAVEAKCLTEQFPDCPERIHERAMILKEMVSGGTEDILRMYSVQKAALF